MKSDAVVEKGRWGIGDGPQNDSAMRTPQMHSNRWLGSQPAGKTIALAGLIGLLSITFSQISYARQDAPKPHAASPGTNKAPATVKGATPAAAPTAGSEPGTELVKGPQPPDGKWLTDETGRQYFIETTPKIEGRYVRLSEKRIRTAWGVPLDLVKEDDKLFYFKVYKVENVVRTAPVGPTPQQIKEIADSYKSTTTESHSLTFSNFGKGLPTRGQWRNGFDIADMNGDGHPDIVHGPARKSLSNPAIFLGDGKGNWRRWAEAKFPSFPFDYGDAKAADLNGDGHQDIVLAIHLNGLTALLGDGKGNF